MHASSTPSFHRRIQKDKKINNNDRESCQHSTNPIHEPDNNLRAFLFPPHATIMQTVFMRKERGVLGIIRLGLARGTSDMDHSPNPCASFEPQQVENTKQTQLGKSDADWAVIRRLGDTIRSQSVCSRPAAAHVRRRRRVAFSSFSFLLRPDSLLRWKTQSPRRS